MDKHMSKLSAIGDTVISIASTTAGLLGDTRALLYTDADFARLYTMMKKMRKFVKRYVKG